MKLPKSTDLPIFWVLYLLLGGKNLPCGHPVFVTSTAMAIAIVKLMPSLVDLLTAVLHYQNGLPWLTCWQLYLLSSDNSVQPLSKAARPPEVTENNSSFINSSNIRCELNLFFPTLADEAALVPRLAPCQMKC